MRKIRFFLIVLFVFLINKLFSQESSFGIALGPNISKFVTSKVEPLTEIKVGYNIGFNFEKNLIKHLDLRLGIYNYNIGSKSMDITFVDQNGSIETIDKFKWKENYFGIPVLLKPYIGDKVKGYLKVGFNFSYLINSKFIAPSVYSKNDNGGFDMKKFDFGQILGLGVEMPLSDKFCLGFETGVFIAYTSFDKNSSNYKNRAYMSDFMLKYKIK